MRILVSVASRHGATQEIGGVVAEVLAGAGHEVDEIDPDDVGTLAPYAAVVLGSAVYDGRVGAALRELVDRQEGALQARPVWLFWSGPVGDEAPPPEPDDVTTIVRRTGAFMPRCFPGRLKPTDLGIDERAVVARIDPEPGDFRDLDDVRAWAASIAEQLVRPRGPGG
ncbi:flavodoxin domain-containing protein [Cellulomonas chengniuliangii]|uniref:Flavodoxin domain-containing protein n=1 Tax=Cellulomonas chengniuliangii TaxID=2968084 RepID=A0ABY5L3V4_9CELL|nr:flavodoxin domain-containing protein [Cellulomonas chengniuliangii]MCC2308139.1 flavodoxin domain-containing protein [Cellulomonas chengniuliangii]MCC2317147.1 flavodoxin domain-containing protein [Cellulomonas chengniuliangii]UUI76533.1 flavodoxin domain-containing protein [Cellulomonas chengniuliangii]